MAEKLNHAVAVQALHSICTESEHLVNSGDVRVSGEARRDYLVSSILLQLLSTVEPDQFTNAELAKLPTPEELRAADDGGLAGRIVESQSGTNPNPQPQTADQLEDQNSGAAPLNNTDTVPVVGNTVTNNDATPVETTPATEGTDTPVTEDDLTPSENTTENPA